MSTRNLSERVLKARIVAAERSLAGDTGLQVFLTLVQLEQLADREVPVLGIEVDHHGQRVRFDRLPGENFAALHARANPRGSWRAHPVPIMGEVIHHLA